MNEKNKVVMKCALKSYLKVLLYFFIIFLLAGVIYFVRVNINFDFFAEREKYDELTKRDAGEVYSDWGEAATGSAKYLDGDSVVVSIFLNDKSASWTEEEKNLVYNNLEIACKYLETEGEKYGKDVNLIYDYKRYDDLVYKFDFNRSIALNINSDEKATYEDVYYKVMDFIEDEIPIEDIMKNHHVNSIAFLVYVDDKSNNAEAYCYYDDYSYYYEEVAFINTYWLNSKRQVAPDIYAHEILHLFGARDLYETKKISGITRDFIEYVADDFSDDIMLGHAANCIEFQNKIEQKITKITAYFLGWEEYISEIEKFPGIEVKEPAVFSIVSDEYGDYKDFTLDTRLITAKEWYSRLVNFLIDIYVFCLFLRMLFLLYKQRKINEVQKRPLFEYQEGTMWREEQPEYGNDNQKTDENRDF